MYVPEKIELNCPPGNAWQFRESRRSNDPRISDLELPRLPDNPSELFTKLSLAEALLIPERDYEAGSAQVDNDLFELDGQNGVLLTAEHATFHYRVQEDGSRAVKISESGTAAVSFVVANETESNALINIGRQTGDANNDLAHPTKLAMTEIIARPEVGAHFAIHGMRRGWAARATADRGYSVMLGIGYDASEATRTLVYDYLVDYGVIHDLLVGVNQPFIDFDLENKKINLNPDGTVVTRVFVAPEQTTRGHAQSVAKELGKDDNFAAVQIELSSILRYDSDEVTKIFPTQRDHELGAYLGYLFVKKAVESVALL